MKRWMFAVLAVALGGVVLPASAAPPPQPDVALEIREGKRPFPEFLRQLEKKGHPKLRGDRQVRKILRDMKRRRGEDTGIQSFPAPGDGLFDGRAPAAISPAPPALGPANALALLASFADVPPWEDPAYFDSLVFGSIAPSLSHYYGEVSGGSFSIATGNPPSDIQCTAGVGPCTVDSPPGWLPLPQNKATYQSDLRAMLVDAVAAADNDVDFSSYDSDSDGFVDYLILVHAGTGGEWSGNSADIWSQTVSVAPVETADGVSIDTFMTVPEYWFQSQFGRMTIGVYVHEFGHLMGLPDLYDYGLDSKGIGDWGLMGLGMWNGTNSRGESPSWPGAWDRVALGWVVPETPLSDLAGAVLTPVEQGGPVYYLWDYGDDNSEFFLIENRRRLAGTYDAYLPGQGLLIWHIDENMPNNNFQITGGDQNDCNWPNHYRVALQQADGYMNLERNVNDGDIADPYPGSYSITAFSPTSTADFPPRTPPNSGSYADCSSLVAVRNILALGDNIQADLAVSGPPVGSILIDDGAETATTTAVTLSLSASMTGGSSLGYMRFRNGDVVTWDDWEPYQSTKAWTLTAGDGTKTVYAQFKDYLGYISDSDPVTPGEQPYEDTIVLDSAAPVGTILIDNGAATTVTTAVTLTLAATDSGGTGVEAMRFRNGGVATWDDWEPYQSTKAWTLTAGDGIKTVYVQFSDNAGNVSDSADTIVLDSTAPVGTILIDNGAAATGTTAVTLFLAATDSGGTGVEAMRFRNGDVVTWDDWEPYQSTKAWSLTAGDGTKTVYAQFKDYAGNTFDSDDSILLDLTNPIGTVLINDDAAATRTRAVTLTISASFPGGSGPGTMRFRNGGVGTWSSWGSYRTTRAWKLTSGDGTKTVIAQFRDNAGNISESEDTIILDRTRPTGSILINNGDATTVTTAVTLFLSAEDPGGSGVDAMRFRNGGVRTWDGWEPYQATRAWELTAGAGTKTVYAQFRDIAGNISDANRRAAGVQAYKDRIVHDPTAPTGIIRINGGAAATGTTAVTLSLSAKDTGGSGLGSMRFRNDGVGDWDSWEPYKSARPWVLTAGAGTKTVSVQFRDNAGNVSESEDTIVLDFAAPAGAILIDNDAAATGTPYVTLFLAATDSGGSGVGAMRFRNGDVGSWCGWGSYRTTKAWKLASGDGAKTVTAQFRDNAGNISESEDTILLDRTGPTGDILINNGDATTVTTAVTLSLPAEDPGGSGLDAMRFRNGGVSAWDGWEPYQDTKAWTLTAGAGTKTVYAQFKDNVGNISDANPAASGKQGYKDTIQYTGL